MANFRSLAIRDATPDDVDYVVRRMRPLDRVEIFGARFTADAESLISEILHSGHVWLYAIASRHHPRAIAILQLVLHGPGHGYVNLFATGDMTVIVQDFTRFIRKRFIPDCLRAGLRRVELRTLASWVENRRWLEALGAKFECVCIGIGVEPYAQYAWIKEGDHVQET